MTILEQNDLDQTHTVCKGCVWQERSDGVQTGCMLDRIEKYGDCVVEAEDEDEKFYVVNGRFCNARRDESWDVKKFPFNVVWEEIKIGFDVVILFDGDFTALQQTLDILSNAPEYKYSPSKLNLIIVHKLERSATLVSFMRPFTNFSWQIEHVHEDASDLRMIDLAINHTKSQKQYYAVFRAGFPIPPTFFASINNFVNEELGRFVILTPYDDLNGLTIQKMLHKIFVGNGDSSIPDKVKAAELSEKMVIPASQLCPQ